MFLLRSVFWVPLSRSATALMQEEGSPTEIHHHGKERTEGLTCCGSAALQCDSELRARNFGILQGHKTSVEKVMLRETSLHNLSLHLFFSCITCFKTSSSLPNDALQPIIPTAVAKLTDPHGPHIYHLKKIITGMCVNHESSGSNSFSPPLIPTRRHDCDQQLTVSPQHCAPLQTSTSSSAQPLLQETKACSQLNSLITL